MKLCETSDGVGGGLKLMDDDDQKKDSQSNRSGPSAEDWRALMCNIDYKTNRHSLGLDPLRNEKR